MKKNKLGVPTSALILLLSFLLTSCGNFLNNVEDKLLSEISDDTETLLTVDGREVPGWRYFYWFAQACEDIEKEYQERGESLNWSALSDDDKVLLQNAKEQALSDTALYATVENMAERYSCMLTEEDEEALEQQWQERCNAHGGEQEYLESLTHLGLTKERALELARVGQLYKKLLSLCINDGELIPDHKTLDTFAKENGEIYIDRILITSESREAAQNRISEIFAKLNGAEDQATLFSNFAAESDDKNGVRKLETGTLDKKLMDAIKFLDEGQISGILESEEGFSIIRRIPADRNILLEKWFDSELQREAEEAEIELTEKYKTLDTVKFVSVLEELED